MLGGIRRRYSGGCFTSINGEAVSAVITSRMKTLLADPLVLKLEKIVLGNEAIVAHVKTRSRVAACQACHQQSAKIQSRYSRSIADLPWEGIIVRIHLQVRKFFCRNEASPLLFECVRQDLRAVEKKH